MWGSGTCDRHHSPGLPFGSNIRQIPACKPRLPKPPHGPAFWPDTGRRIPGIFGMGRGIPSSKTAVRTGWGWSSTAKRSTFHDAFWMYARIVPGISLSSTGSDTIRIHRDKQKTSAAATWYALNVPAGQRSGVAQPSEPVVRVAIMARSRGGSRLGEREKAKGRPHMGTALFFGTRWPHPGHLPDRVLYHRHTRGKVIPCVISSPS